MSFWALAGLMIAVALGLILRPLLRGKAEAGRRQDHDLHVYRDQLAEVERDLERGVISPPEAVAARSEIERRILRADDGEDAPAAPEGGRSASRLVALVLCLALPLLAVVTYYQLGSPGLPGKPFADRQDRPGSEQEEQIIARLQQRLAETPDDADAWTLLGDFYARLGRWAEAGAAYRDALKADGAHQKALLGVAESLVAQAQGVVVPEARRNFAAVLEKNPRQPTALYYAGLALAQDGLLENAYEVWSALVQGAPPEAPWVPLVERQLARLADELNRQEPAPEAAPAGPSQEDVEAAAEMSPEDREAFIRAMVQRLADRLQEEPDDLEGWLRLARSYRVLGEDAEVEEALSAAEALVEDLPADAPARASVAAARKELEAEN